MNYITLVIISFFYVGKIKYAPGTFASLFTAIIWYFISNIILIQITIIFCIGILSLIMTNQYLMKYPNFKDPKFIVIDEVLGMSIALFMLPKIFSIYLSAFVVFRILDIFKPSIIYHSENFNNGLGVILDDIISGLITLLIVQTYLHSTNMIINTTL